VKALAIEKGIPVLTPEKISDDTAMATILSWKPEAVVVVAFGQILPQKFLDLFPGRVVNVHGSLLPRWRGAAPIQRAIMADDKVTGVALQVMVKKLDAGDVIGSYALPITDDMDAMKLHDALMPLGAKLLHVELMDYIRGSLVPVRQDEALVTYASKLDKAESHLQWSRSSRELFCRIRGMLLGPGSFAMLGGKKVKIWKSECLGGPTGAGGSGSRQVASDQVGRVVAVTGSTIDVQCGAGVLRLFEVQPESRPRMAVKDFLLGHKVSVGDRFE
jgi:methionyl-tRNA formyltransferase